MFSSKNQYKKELETALRAVGEAALLCKAVQVDIGKDQLHKEDRSPVTVADFGSQALICRAVNESFPNDPIIAEEESGALLDPNNAEILDNLIKRVRARRSGVTAKDICEWIDLGGAERSSQRFWTLDPIDGTKGFLRGDQYAVALALIVDGKIRMAVLGCPNTPFDPDKPKEGDACFFAVSGFGGFAAQLGGGTQPRQINVSEICDIKALRVCESFEAAHSSHEDSKAIAKYLGITAEPIRIDSQAKYGLLARGQGDIYLRLPKGGEYREKIWDHAAGALIVEEAGGKVTDINGNALDFTRGKKLELNLGVIASNGEVHDEILNAIQHLGISDRWKS